MSCLKKLNEQFGFTLVELAVVLGIVSALAIGSATLFTEQKVNIDRETSEAKLVAVKGALLRFVEKNHYLPCPDVNVQGHSGFGAENRVNTSAVLPAIPASFGSAAQAETASTPFIPAVPATPAIPARTVNVNVCVDDSGSVPFDELGLSLSDVMDSQGNLFHYAVTKGVVTASNLANCPIDSACFFNRDTTPAFNFTTEPVAGSLGVNNLVMCAGISCAGVNLLGDGLVAVILAYNERANNNLAGLSAEEAENRDGDAMFIKMNYSEDDFDDLLVSISGYELKRKEEKEFQRNTTNTLESGQSFSGNDLVNMGDNSLGGSGTNVGTDEAIWDRVNQTFDFGSKAANQEIVLTYNTYAVGSWDQPRGVNSNVTSDTGTVSNNGTLVKEYKYDYTDNTQDGVVAVSFVAGFTGLLDSRDQYGNAVTLSITEGETVNTYADYWNDTTEVVLQADSTGQVDLEFAVGTTATFETIDFTDIELVYYSTPPPVPDFPSVSSVSGITQTDGLE